MSEEDKSGAPFGRDMSEFNAIFLHAQLDEFGLTPAEFRIYAHISRRAGTGVGWPGIDSMAKLCFLSKPTVIASVKRLELMNMLIVYRKSGEGNRYRLTKPSVWVGQRTKPSPAGTGKQETTDQLTKGNGASKNEVTKVHPREVHPREVHPRKSIQKSLFGISSDDLPPPLNTPEIQDAWDIWREHLRQKRKPLTEEAARMQIKDMMALGPEKALAALRHSTKSGYQGLFEPKEDRRAKKSAPYLGGDTPLTKDNAV